MRVISVTDIFKDASGSDDGFIRMVEIQSMASQRPFMVNAEVILLKYTSDGEDIVPAGLDCFGTD